MGEAYEKALKSIPAPGGNGCHVALLRVANIGVLQGLSDSQLVSDLRANIPAGKRSVPDKEIEDAVKKARETAKGTPRENRPLVGYDWDDVVSIQGHGGGGECARFEMPTGVSLDNFRRQLEAMFLPDEKPMIEVGSKDGRPTGKGEARRTRDELLAELSKYEKNHSPEEALRYAIGDWTEGGAWIRVNPMDGEGGGDANVAAYRHALVECDGMKLEEQLEKIRELRLPCVCITYSGGKSIHAVVKIDAADKDEYRDRVSSLFEFCARNGMELDTANSNPSRFTRLAGVTRGERRQAGIDVPPQCCDSWTAWSSWRDDGEEEKGFQEFYKMLERATGDGRCPDIMGATIPPNPAVFHDFISKGDMIMIGGSSGAGKSLFALQLALCLAGGRTWLDKYAAEGPKKVLYFDYELRPYELQGRVRGQLRELNIPEEDVKETFQPHALRVFRHEIGGLNIGGFRGGCAFVYAAAKRFNPDVIILDPLYKFGNIDENDSKEVGALMETFEILQTKCGDPALFIVHHFGKGSTIKGRDAIDMFSGSGVFGREMDLMMTLTGNGTGDPDAFVLKFPKVRSCPREKVQPMGVRKTFPIFVPDNAIVQNMEGRKDKETEKKSFAWDLADALVSGTLYNATSIEEEANKLEVYGFPTSKRIIKELCILATKCKWIVKREPTEEELKENNWDRKTKFVYLRGETCQNFDQALRALGGYDWNDPVPVPQA